MEVYHRWFRFRLPDAHHFDWYFADDVAFLTPCWRVLAAIISLLGEIGHLFGMQVNWTKTSVQVFGRKKGWDEHALQPIQERFKPVAGLGSTIEKVPDTITYWYGDLRICPPDQPV